MSFVIHVCLDCQTEDISINLLPWAQGRYPGIQTFFIRLQTKYFTDNVRKEEQ